MARLPRSFTVHPAHTRKRISYLAISGLFTVLISTFTVIAYREIRRARENRQLISAVKHNDVSRTLALLAQGADANAVDTLPDPAAGWRKWLNVALGRDRLLRTGPCALQIATRYGYDGSGSAPDNVATVKALLDHGAAIDTRDDKGATPLMAAACGKPRVARLLMARGADVNAHDHGGYTPLMEAVLYDQDAICELLLKRHAEVNARDSDGRTALMVAANGQHESIVPLLLRYKADVSVKARSGETALEDAERKLPDEYVDMLKKAE